MTTTTEAYVVSRVIDQPERVCEIASFLCGKRITKWITAIKIIAQAYDMANCFYHYMPEPVRK